VLNLNREQIENFISKIDFKKGNGLVPAIIQDETTNEILMQAYMNEETLRLTLKTGKTHFWSRTRKKVWLKGEESGHHSLVQNAILDCDNDALIFQVRQIGPICHTGKKSCFHNSLTKIEEKVPNARILERIFAIIEERRDGSYERSYVNGLIKKGEGAILEKISEEAAELMLATKEESESRLISEAADLIFHIMIVLASKKIELSEIFNEFEERHKAKTVSKKG
jgi:phosphoribosyl-ATP pyrophosphohydrolase/phosphoribosyl-AMP cyclohydrolase